MPIYISKAYLSTKKGVVGPDEEVELTEEQAKRLSGKVEKKSARKTNKDEEGGK